MKFNIFIKVLFILSLCGCKIQQAQQPDSPPGVSNELNASNTIEYEIIKDWVKDKKIVALGESSHGIGDFYSLKSDLVKYLHEHLGFEVILMEAGMGDILLAWEHIDKYNAFELREMTVYGNFSCTEVAPLFDYIKEQSMSDHVLLYGGFDPQLSTNYYQSFVEEGCTYLDLEVDVKEAFNNYFKMYQASFESDSTNFATAKNTYLTSLITIKDAFENNRTLLMENLQWNELELKIILRTLDMQYQAVNYHYADKLNSDNMHQAIVLRDQYMAENVQWLLEHIYPNKKIVLWGHHGHIQKGNVNNFHETKAMGQHLKDLYGEDYLSIGLFAYQGKAYQHWTGEAIPFENSDSTSFEFQMKRDHHRYTYQKFGNTDADHWSHKEFSAFEVESGTVYFTPSERFDAAICIDRVKIPTFPNK